MLFSKMFTFQIDNIFRVSHLGLQINKNKILNKNKLRMFEYTTDVLAVTKFENLVLDLFCV